MNKLLTIFVIISILASQASAIDIKRDQDNNLTFSNCELACTKQGGFECGGKCCNQGNCKKNQCSSPIAIQGCF
ncbi:hypothetical protein pb186bvf_006500 [Paramecium bursaria]